MAIEFHLHRDPPPAKLLELTRRRLERSMPLVIGALVLTMLLDAHAHLRLAPQYPEWESIIDDGLIFSGFLVAYLLWKLVRNVCALARLGEAHPVTAPAYLACSSSDAVKSYCNKVMQQGRNLTMAEAELLLQNCKTRAEILKLAEYYEQHAPLPMVGYPY